ncbi:uncharacterized [Tachysurus ichikawai]
MEMERGIRASGATEHSDVVPGYRDVNAGEEAHYRGLEGTFEFSILIRRRHETERKKKGQDSRRNTAVTMM